MIGNKYLQQLFRYPDEDTAINQLLEFLHSNDSDFINSLYNDTDVRLFDEKELVFMTKIAALIDYLLQLKGLEVPSWLRDSRLAFDRPFYYSRRLSDFDKIRLQYICPAPFRNRNVYFDLDSLKRV